MVTSLASQYLNFITRHASYFILIIIWLLSVIVVSPVGEFPLNDDWIYLQVLKNLYDFNKIVFTDWISSTLIAQLWWGLLFCKLFGYKIIVARISTLVTTFLISVVLYNLCRKVSGNKTYAVLVTGVFIFNPILYVQSFTFMTESSFNLSMLLCIFFSCLFLEQGNLKSIFFATLFGCIAVLIKQPGLIASACLPVIFITNKPFRWRSFSFAIISMIIVFLTYYLYIQWLNSNFSKPDHVNGVIDILKNKLSSGYSHHYIEQRNNIKIILLYSGVFILPLLPIILYMSRKALIENINYILEEGGLKALRSKKGFQVAVNGLYILLVFLFGLFSFIYTSDFNVPCIENVLYNLGLGPIVLYDTFILKINLAHFEVSPIFWRWISCLGFFTSLILVFNIIVYYVVAIIRSRRGMNSRDGLLFQLLLYISIVYAFLLINVYMFDRYIIALIPLQLLMLTIAGKNQIHYMKNNYFIPITCLIGIFVFFDMAATHDYMEWNNAKWKALNILTTDKKISPDEIDGGYEFNGIHNYSSNYIKENNKSWWWVKDNKYVAAMGPIPGYEIFFAVPYSGWLTTGNDSICILKKNFNP